MISVKNCSSAKELVEQHVIPKITAENYGVIDKLIKINHAFLLVKKDGLTTLKFIRYHRVGVNWNFEIQEEQEITMSVTCPLKLLNRSENKHPKAISWRKRIAKSQVVA